MVAAAGLQDSVRLVRPRAELAEAYVDADLFALSSRWEGFPYVLLEAMSFGLPVVSTAVDGIPEAVVDGVTGALVPPENPPALARALNGLLSDPARRRSFGEAGQRRVADAFTLDHMIERLCGVYSDLLR
jgi:glycosyltransferase involved in cell wall biosynthesis